MTIGKEELIRFWNEAACGEKLYLEDLSLQNFKNHSEIRYQLEPFIFPFADFENTKNKKVLEIGVGLGADHQRFAEAGAILTGIDLTPRAIELTQQRFQKFDLKSDLKVGDAENLMFPDNSFDVVYSWGVIHHSPNTQKAAHEIFRVLKPGGKTKIMIYHKYSLVGFMLWVRYAFLMCHPFTSLSMIYANHLESPGTKAYSTKEAELLFRKFENISIKTQLTHADLLTSQAGQRHKGMSLNLGRVIWPRWFFKKFCQRYGLFMLIEATKPVAHEVS